MSWIDEHLRPGMQVRLMHNPVRIGMLTEAEPRHRNGRRIFQVRFPDIVERVYEDQFEPLVQERMNPLDLLAGEKLGTPKDLRRTLAHVRLTGRLADIIYSMEATNTDFYAYQFKPVLKLLQTPTNGILIADEVGLGKTIEAGLIWTELRSRFNLNRLVVLCPAALREKWRDELVHKLGVNPTVCDAKETLRVLKDTQAQARGFAIVVSMQGLRPPRGWEEEDKKSHDAQLARYLQEMEGGEPLVDVLVVDEAHHMRNSESQTNQLGALLRGVSEYLVMLSATPIHNQNRDLFSLLHLLDPDTFSRHEDFVDILDANAPLVRARDIVLSGGIEASELIGMLDAAKSNRLLHGNRQLETLIAQISDESLKSLKERSQIAYRLETVNLLGHAVTRTRKRDVKEWRVVRDPQPEFIPMTDVESDFYDLVSEIVTNYSLDRDISEAFLLVTPQRQMASCMPAALKSWREKRIEIPEDQLTWTDQDQRRRRELGPLTSELVARSGEFVDLEELKESDSKYARLSEMLTEFFKLNEGRKEKVIIFSTYRGTLAYLSERLWTEGMSNIVLQGGGSRTKDDIIAEFRSPDGPSILLSSEVGGEGVDLQFCWVVVNYDLPWNPMRVEQRIGRVDRIGQESEKVLIWNLFYEGTVDARIYRRLYDKLDLCRNALGDFEAILGDEIKKLTKDLLTGRLTPEQQEERINQTAIALETRKKEEERLEAEASHLVAYGDYILQQVHAAKDMHRWINGGDLYAYVTDFLNIHYPGYDLIETNGANLEYEINLTEATKHDLSDFLRQMNLLGETRLALSGSARVPCKFENRVSAGTVSKREIISQFHPLVRFISARITETAEQIRPAVAVKLSMGTLDPPMPAGTYVVAVSLWSVQGLRDVEKLVFEGASLDDPGNLLGNDEAERLAINCAAHGKLWLEAKNACSLSRAHDIANERLFGVLDERFRRFVSDESAQNEDRADIQARNLEHHVVKQRESILGIIDKHRRAKKPQLIPANEGRLRSLEARAERQRIAIDTRRKMTERAEDICVVVASVE